MKTRVCHELISLFYSASLKNFAADLKNVEAVQRQRLSEILQNLQGSSKWKELAGHSYEELTAIVPKSTYSDYSKEILQQKKSGENIL
ncbi:MAG TPA: GH3 auxin-responsive promoter family protein, partial [Bdellovibrio sp.]|nr:GH3 auxin-responsive promoter family protein [Bdellovibrio sp.]